MVHLIFGASENPARASYVAAKKLNDAGYDWIPLSINEGYLFEKKILSLPEMPEFDEVDTITLYLNPSRQEPYIDYIKRLKPKRVIFNPGTENPKLMLELKNEGIEVLQDCTLVMLSINLY
jgi:predicted CoA-binding protein